MGKKKSPGESTLKFAQKRRKKKEKKKPLALSQSQSFTFVVSLHVLIFLNFFLSNFILLVSILSLIFIY